jgi:hypothetical protein
VTPVVLVWDKKDCHESRNMSTSCWYFGNHESRVTCRCDWPLTDCLFTISVDVRGFGKHTQDSSMVAVGVKRDTSGFSERKKP